ncbi:Succinate dehydrogenase [Pleurostoma richardsiae]|uniref:Succinate dehydrogenase n=1 Tax=Pleurostoma richardsiae TaxID=41990 RepID=A0AA38VK74_9PEZI|nr:Succinate dehydrogenase [Pleurostoma richardsiae]
MPIFEDHLGRGIPAQKESQDPVTQPIPIAAPPIESLTRRLSEESLRTELCEGPIPDSPRPPSLRTPPERDVEAATSDRAELIERLKRGESPTWIPNRHLESLYRAESLSPSKTPRRPNSRDSPTLLPPADIASERHSGTADDVAADEERLQNGLNIERPRSALHSGDFTQHEEALSKETEQRTRDTRREEPDPSIHEANRHTWIATSPPRDFTHAHFDWNSPPLPRHAGSFTSRISSLSSSLSTSFVYKPPTSPLVQSESNDDIDLSLPMHSIDITTSSPVNRRHTLNFSHGLDASQGTPSIRRESSYPYQAHQPRRSLTSTPSLSLLSSSPQTPAFSQSRRPSLSTDLSPLNHASMVGSYEESILRGRMSTSPSKPLDFLAQIGVLGLGNCKANLRCPAHVTLPFSAVFYSYASTPHGRSKSDDGPSPYVGQIDLENGLQNPEEELRARRKLQNRNSDRRSPDGDVDMVGTPEGPDSGPRKSKRQKRRSSSPKAPPGGSYRIPEKGQLQIIIKNQNKTAVKLFLVPYDLAGMEPGTKTFIRQRSYSAGPIIDNIPALKEAPGADRAILRYLIHLHICCPSRGRYYLYKSIRVVFANRVPDGKEKLRNEVTVPEPRFTAYKPIRVMHPPVSVHTSGPGAMLAAEKAFRRRSSGFTFGQYPNHGFDPSQSMPPHLPHSHSTGHQSLTPLFGGGNTGNAPVEPIPFRLTSRGGRPPGAGCEQSAHDQLSGSSPGGSSRATGSRPATQESGSGVAPSWSDGVGGVDARYDKLSRGDVGYGGNAFAPPVRTGSSPGAAEGLLSQRLRSLGVRGRDAAAAVLQGEDGEEAEM